MPLVPHFVVMLFAVDGHTRPHNDEFRGRHRWLPDTDQAFHQALEVRFQLGVASARHIDRLANCSAPEPDGLVVERVCVIKSSASSYVSGAGIGGGFVSGGGTW